MKKKIGYGERVFQNMVSNKDPKTGKVLMNPKTGAPRQHLRNQKRYYKVKRSIIIDGSGEENLKVQVHRINHTQYESLKATEGIEGMQKEVDNYFDAYFNTMKEKLRKRFDDLKRKDEMQVNVNNNVKFKIGLIGSIKRWFWKLQHKNIKVEKEEENGRKKGTRPGAEIGSGTTTKGRKDLPGKNNDKV